MEDRTPEVVMPPKIDLKEKRLTIILAVDEQQYCAYCPELDLVTEMPSTEEAIQDMLEAMTDYAEDYTEELELYSKSPNRAHHLPYVRSISACDDLWDLRMLTEIIHGRVHV